MKNEILTMLREHCPDYVSGQALCEQFGVSRTAVWKAIKQLEKEGYVIEAVRNRGYRLAENMDVLNQAELDNHLHFKWIAGKKVYEAVTGSTNTDLKTMAEEGEPHGTLVVAGDQQAGKGRRGRSWQVPAEKTIAMSVLLRPTFPADHASMITLLQAYAVALAVEDVCGVQTQIKWPNDVVVNGKKICGILTEMSISLEQKEIAYVIVGTGINVNIEEFPEELQKTATSLKLETGHEVSRVAIIERVLHYFEEAYDEFEKVQNLSFIKEVYEAHMANKDREVHVLDPQHPFDGVARGIDNQGELLVEKEDGTVEAVYAGEVSVRGIYGYV